MPGVSIVLRSVAKARGGRPVLRDVSLEAADGEWLAVLGPSGAGKTTLLRLLAGFERPDGGDLRVGGVEPARVPPAERGVGMLFQELALWPAVTAEDHLGPAAERLLPRFGLAGLAARRPSELSGGERQRLALARAVAREPRLLLLDEPFSGLDPLARRGLVETLADLHRASGMTVVVVSHHLEAPVARASRVALLREGRIEQVAPLAELRAAPANEWVASFLADEAGVEVP